MMSKNKKPFVVDLDGTLIYSDLLAESALLFARKNPLRALFLCLFWLGKGKAHLKEQLAKRVKIDVSVLPYNPTVLTLIESARASGREVILATASHKIHAERIAGYLGCFDLVLSTSNGENLSASKKAVQLVTLYGEGGYDYIGNSEDDLKVWDFAAHALMMNVSKTVEKKARSSGKVTAEFNDLEHPALMWIKAVRLHQWVKNTLMFVPLFASHKIFVGDNLFVGAIAFLAFSLCASSIYLLNDLLDLEDDRHHAQKKNRPLAAGQINISRAIIAFPLLLIISFSLAWFAISPIFLLVLAFYYALTLLYSFVLKRVMIVDVITLAMLYTMRLIAGIVVFQVPATFWLLAFSMFIFLSLAFIKRYSELYRALEKGKVDKTRGRGYYPSDLEMISSLGAASGYLSVMVLALYIQDSSTTILYTTPEIIWLACPILLFWVSRTWLLAHRGEIHDDPVVFAVKDRVSLCVGALFVSVFWLASWV